MGHGHVAPDSASGRHVRTLGISLVVLLAFLVSEVAVGLATGSLALLSDTGHMFTAALGVGMTLAAITAARSTTRSTSTTCNVWTLTSGMEVGSAHLEVDTACDQATVLSHARALLADDHGIPHSTVQVEPPGSPHGCSELSW